MSFFHQRVHAHFVLTRLTAITENPSTRLCRRTAAENVASNASKSSSLFSTTGDNRGDDIFGFDDDTVTGANRASCDSSMGVAKPICDRGTPPRSCRQVRRKILITERVADDDDGSRNRLDGDWLAEGGAAEDVVDLGTRERVTSGRM